MKNIFILSFALLACLICRGQGFSKAEYFFDTDPGVNNGTAVNLTGSQDTLNFSTPVSTASLAPGFHFLGLRVRHNDGTWGLFANRGFYISTATANSADITAAEYFFDNDPGVGNGIATSVGASGPIVNFTAVIPTSLGTGFHFLAIRTRGTDGIWGLLESRGFYISSSSANAADISAAEYFFDADPGNGNGTATPVGANGPTVNFTAVIPTSLGTGFHFLAIRTRGTDGMWGLFEKRGFYISSTTANAANIMAAEYFFDTDPGVGNGIATAVGPSGATVNFTAVIPTSLSVGFHFLSIRVKGADGMWGLFEKRGFYISQSTADMPIVMDAEYFFDTDPGVGNATSLSVTSPGNSFTQTFNIPVPGTMPDGPHFLAIRVKDQGGEWGLFEYRQFEVGGIIPVTGLTFMAKKDGGKVNLEWYTISEINSSHFEIEKSLDGNEFVKIGQVHAAGNSNVRRDYLFTDNNPSRNINYYRLKQLDRDGRHVYSEVRIIRYNDDKDLKIYPVVTTGMINITGLAEPVKVKFFNTGGQLVKTSNADMSAAGINISALPAATYWLVVEKKGEILLSQKIIKY